MTLIAAYTVKGCPCLIGDIIVSGPKMSVDRIALPTVGSADTVFPDDAGYYISDTQQKVSVITERLAVAWAGNQIIASSIINDLRERIASSENLYADYTAFMLELQESVDSDKVSFVGWLEDGPKTWQISYGVVTTAICESFGKVSVAGSGGDRFLRMLQKYDGEHRAYRPDALPFFQACMSTYAFIGKLISEEFDSATSLLHFYGGAYELVVYANGEFTKLGNLTTFISELILHASKYERAPLFYMKHDYAGDMMRLRVLNSKTDEGSGRVILVRPAGSYRHQYAQDELDRYLSEPTDYNSFWHYLRIHARFKDDKSTVVLQDLSHELHGKWHIQFPRSSKQKFDFAYDDEFLEFAYTEFHRIFARAAMEGRSLTDRAFYRMQ